MANHSANAKGAMELLAELEKDESKGKLKEFLNKLEHSGFFTNENLEIVDAQLAVRKKIDNLLKNITVLTDLKLTAQLKDFHEKLSKSIEVRERESAHGEALVEDRERTKEFLFDLPGSNLENILSPVYELMQRDENKEIPELQKLLKQAQMACESLLNSIKIKKKDMTREEQVALADEIKKNYWAKTEPVIERYKQKAEKMEVQIKAKAEAEAKANEKAETEAKAKRDAEEVKVKKEVEEKAKAEAEEKVKMDAQEAAKTKTKAEAEAKMDSEHGEGLEMNKKFTAEKKVEAEAKAGAEAKAKKDADETKAKTEAKAKKKAEAEKKLQSLTSESLFKEILIKPDEYKPDSENPVIRAVVELTKGLSLENDKSKLGKLASALRTSGKIPTATQAQKIEEMNNDGITTSDELEKDIKSLGVDISKKKKEMKHLTEERETIKVVAAKSGTNQVQTDRLEEIAQEVAATDGQVDDLEGKIKDYTEVQPFIGSSKMSPRQLLLKMINFKFKEDVKNKDRELSLLELGEMADKLIATEEKKMAPARKWREGWGELDKYTQLIKPSLKATLAEFTKIEALKEMKVEELEELVKLRDDPKNLAVWIEKLKEKAKAVVPALMAYLQMAIVEGKLNMLSRGQAVELLKNIRSVRNKRILSLIDDKPELKNAQVRMQAYLSEMNEWDEKSVLVNREIIDSLVSSSYKSAAIKAGVAITAVALIGPGTILHVALKHIGLGALAKIGAVYGTFKGKKMVGEYKPEWKTKYELGAPAAVGLALVGWPGLVLGPIGLAAPELMSKVKFYFDKRKENKEKGGKEETSIKWAIASSIGSALAYPFKKLLGKKQRALPKPRAA